MKTFIILATLVAATSFAAAQGSLTPPVGPPGPVMKTLDQIEARTPVTADTCPPSATANFVIGNPGSYYLTGNIIGQAGKAGLQINAVGVILDLNGFSLTAAVGSTKGIIVSSAGGPVVIRNGNIRLWPNQGIHFTAASDFTIQDVNIYGVQGRGIEAQGRGTIERVSIQTAKDAGISCMTSPQVIIRDCRVENITSTGQAMGIQIAGGIISNCAVSTVSGTTSGGTSVAGISASDGVVEACSVTSVTQNGSGKVSGIELANQVNDCSVYQINGNSGASSSQYASGVNSCENVVGCTVKVVAAGNSHYSGGIVNSKRVSGCRVYSISGSAYGSGIYSDYVDDCFVESVSGDGIRGEYVTRNRVMSCNTGISLYGTEWNATAKDNTVTYVGGIGIYTTSIGNIVGNTVSGYTSSNSTGIRVNEGTDRVRVEGNHVTHFATGIYAPHATTLVVRNSAGANTTNFNLHANMPVVAIGAIGTNPNANISQ